MVSYLNQIVVSTVKKGVLNKPKRQLPYSPLSVADSESLAVDSVLRANNQANAFDQHLTLKEPKFSISLPTQVHSVWRILPGYGPKV